MKKKRKRKSCRYLCRGEIGSVNVRTIDDYRDSLLDAVLGDDIPDVVYRRKYEAPIRCQSKVVNA